MPFDYLTETEIPEIAELRSRLPDIEYWKKRADQLIQARTNISEDYIEYQRQIFEQAINDIEERLAVFYSRFANNNNITFEQAQVFLTDPQLAQFHMSLEEYIRLGETLDIDFDQDTWDRMENASIRYRVTRLEAIEMEIRARLEQLYTDVTDNIYECLAEQYRDAYYRTSFEIFKSVGIGIDFARLNTQQLELLLLSPWDETGNDFSSNVWYKKRQMMQKMPSIITQGVIQGQGYDEIARELQKALGTSRFHCEVLVRTESAFFSTQGELDSYDELGIEMYQNVATLDNRTTPICQDMDGTRFKRSQAVPWKTCPPFNYQCRTTTIPVTAAMNIPGYLDRATRAARGKDGKTYRVPASSTYHEWVKTENAQIPKDYWKKFKARHGKNNKEINKKNKT